MHYLDDLPKRHRNHETESKAEAAFQSLLSNSKEFVLQASDRKDYGTDCQIEVIDRENATNVRIHVQLKGTERSVNADGSVSVEIRRSNLNYLLMQPNSFFTCYHVPTDTLRFCFADAIIRRYEHSGQNWIHQQTLTVTFTEILTEAHLKSFAALARSGAASSRNMRVAQTVASPEDLPGIVKAAYPDLYVPEDETLAAAVLSNLYESGADDMISVAFEKFASVLRKNNDAMIFCYMSEINLGLDGRSDKVARIVDGISLLGSKLDSGRLDAGHLHYCIGNGLLALGREEDAVKAYENALQYMTSDDSTMPFGECFKNLGTSYEKLGKAELAVKSFHQALLHNPQLSEAHFALGLHFQRKGEYVEALEHFDQVVFAERTLGKRSSVSGWRLNVLFNLGDGMSAFREINILLGDAGKESWIWPWCAQQVASFGRASLDNAKLSIPFWDRYLRAYPNSHGGVRERLLNRLYLRSEGGIMDMTYPAFKVELEVSTQNMQGDEAAYLWDRLGHWAQENDNWKEAESCYRVAYDLAGGRYGYCLGTALIFLDRPEESLPFLLAQAEEIQPDYMSWYQLAVAYEKLGCVRDSIRAYRKVIALNPNYEPAWFNMGGLHLNAGELEKASQVWKAAVDKFPNHELAFIIRRDFPSVLS